jgi:hypothetical protein
LLSRERLEKKFTNTLNQSGFALLSNFEIAEIEAPRQRAALANEVMK